MRPLPSLVPALCLALAPGVASAIPAMNLTVAPTGEPFQWDLELTNAGSEPAELLADRRLLWLELPPQTPTRGRRPARPRVCAHEARPGSQEGVATVVLGPGERFRERVDLRDLCRMRLPTGLPVGSLVTVHYGFAPRARRGRAAPPSPRRSILRDPSGAAVLPELVAMVPLPALPVDGPPTATPRVSLRVRGGTAARGEGLRLTVRLHNGSVLPFQTFWRPTHFHFALTTPDGRTVPCEVLYRQVPPLRELLARVGPGGTRSVVLTPSSFCPREAFLQAGIYTAVVRFENWVTGEELGLRGVFTGVLESPPVALRVVRGDGRFQPLAPRLDGGAAHDP